MDVKQFEKFLELKEKNEKYFKKEIDTFPEMAIYWDLQTKLENFIFNNIDYKKNIKRELAKMLCNFKIRDNDYIFNNIKIIKEAISILDSL